MAQPTPTDQSGRTQIADMPELLTFAQLGAVNDRTWDWADNWSRSDDFPFRIRHIGRTRYVAKAEVLAWLQGQAS